MTNIPFKKRAMMALTDILAEITPDNGYISNLAEFIDEDEHPTRRVYRGRAFFGDGDPLPMVAILERPQGPDELTEPTPHAQTGAYDWNLVVQGFVDDDKDDPTDEAYTLLADVRKRLGEEAGRKDASGRVPDPLGLGGRRKHNRIESLSFGSGVVRPADEVSSNAYFWLGVTLTVIEDPLFPFA